VAAWGRADPLSACVRPRRIHRGRSGRPRASVPDLRRGVAAVTGFAPLLAVRDAPAVDAREQRARRRARALPRRDLSEVIPLGGPHPSMTLACEACGAEVEALLYCGVVLCVPCWKRKAARDTTEILSTLQAERKRHGRDNFRVRFVTLTIRNGPDLRERMTVLQSAFVRMAHRAFWKSNVDGAVAKTEVTLGQEGWHPHLSFLTVGRYMEQSELSAQWAKATKGAGTIVDIRAVDDVDSIPAEIGKYVAKPMAETKEGKTRLEDWPEEKRRELAALLAGRPRVRWWCREGRSASYAKCHTKDPVAIGFRPHDCNGSFRIELTGFRCLRFYGTLRHAHADAKASRFAARLDSRCAKCGVGKLGLKSRKDWDDIEADAIGWPASLLHLIRGHNSATALRAEASKKAASGQIGTREGASGPPWGDLKGAP
jgi:hypothetical protein